MFKKAAADALGLSDVGQVIEPKVSAYRDYVRKDFGDVFTTFINN